MPRHCLLLLAFIAGNACAATPGVPAGSLFVHPQVLDVPGEEAWTVEAGELFMPENRSQASSRTISIAFYRFASTAKAPATPIFLLAGGPGVAALDDFMEDPEVRSRVRYFTSVSDVVLFDQRGAGHSRPKLDCLQKIQWDDGEVSTRAGFVTRMRESARACRETWQREGIDLNAYNTMENAADTDALREALGYKRIALVANSYGTHLSFALMRGYSASIERAVLYGLEGPDHTYDMPSEILGSLEQIALAAQKSPQLASRIPAGGLLAALKTVEERLDRTPARVTVKHDGRDRTVTVSRFDIQRLSREGVYDLSHLEWPALIVEMYNGDFRRAAKLVLEDRDWPIESAMFFMMDCASGISPERLERIRDSAENRRASEILGDINLAYFSTCDIWKSPDLGAAFRSPLVSDVPVLLIQGTWDVSTPFGNATELARGLKDGTLIKVEGGTHSTLPDLFRSWPPIRHLLDRFLRGETFTAPSVIQLPDPVFVLPDGPG